MQCVIRYALFVLGSSAAFGAVRSNITPSLGHDIWDAGTGFPGGYVNSMTQTADGHIWLGTSKGLVRYDGLTFVPIRDNDSHAETKFPILGVLADSNDQLWATDDHTHLFSYSAGRLAGPLPDQGKHQYSAALLYRTRDGQLLFASELQGMVVYDHASARILLDSSMMPRSPTAVAQTSDGVFWMGTREAGVFRITLAPGGSEIRHFAALSNVKVNCMLPIGDSTLLIGTEKGLLSIHNGNLTRTRPELGSLEILALASGRDGDIWIGSDGHVFKAHATDINPEGKIRVLDRLNVHGTVTALFEDRDGDLWIGGPQVIERYRASGFTSYLSSAGLPCSNCGAVYIDPQNRVWFGPSDGGLFELGQNSIQPIEAAGLKDDTVYSISGGADGDVWVARKYGGVTRFRLRGDGLQAATYTRRDGLPEDSVYSIYRAPDDTMWVGTLTAGLSRFRGETWNTFTTQDGLPSNTILAITGNTAGEIFVGTPSGLAVFKNDHWIAYTTRDGLPPGAIVTLSLDDSDTVWIGTTRGISFLQSGTIHVPLGAPNALYGEILGIAESNGWLWITTHDHVLRVRSAAILRQSFDAGDYREFGLTEGLPSTEGVNRSRSVVKDDRGRIWFSLNNGISVLQPSALARPAFPVITRLDGMLVDGKPLASDDVVHIPAGRHRLTLRYVGVNVSNPDGVRYRYRLDNVDPAWSEPTALREIDYTNIPPGQFRFHVMARNLDGVWSNQETAIAFEVEPTYWQTTWFRVLCVAAFLGLLWALHQYRLHQLQRRFTAGLEARVKERTRIARELHDTLLQSFHGLMFQFQAARNMLPRRPGEAMDVLDSAIGATSEAISEGRSAIQQLRLEQIDEGDFAQWLTNIGRELARSEQTNGDSPVFRLTVEGEQQSLSPLPRTEVYRITREILQNAFRHAQAQHIEAEIRYDDRLLRVRIRDDGTGIDPKILQAGGSAGHWGLCGVRERAEQIGGRLDFWTEAGAGTEVELSVPAVVAYEKWRNKRRFTLFRKEQVS